MMSGEECPLRSKLQQYLDGDLCESEAVAVEWHLPDCLACRTAAQELLGAVRFNSSSGTSEDTGGNGEAAWQPWILNVLQENGWQLPHQLRPDPESPEPTAAPELPVRYEPVRRIGRGGMGEVWEAYDAVVGRAVAVKFLSSAAPGLQETQRLLLEAVALGRLHHPGIVRVHEVISELKHPAIVMEHISGASLSGFVRGRTMSERDAARLVCRLAEAVAHAHMNGILHRDLKPANILLRAVGNPSARRDAPESLADYEPVISDFGLARLAAEHTITLNGQILGTPAYMPPETANALPEEHTCAVDIYGLGTILYELLTGRAPHLGENQAATLVLAQQGRITVPRLLRTGLSADLENICLKCLAFSPADRYASAEALRGDLQAFLEDRPVSARRPGPMRRAFRWGRRNPLPAGLVLLLLIAVTAFLTEVTLSAIRRQQMQEQVTKQLANAIDLIETMLSNLRGNTTAWQAIPEDQQKGIYADAIKVYGDYLEYHCPSGRIPPEHLLHAARRTALLQMLDPNAEITADLDRINQSIMQLPMVSRQTPELLFIRELCAQTGANQLRQKGDLGGAAQQLLAHVEVLRERAELAQSSAGAGSTPAEALQFMRSSSGVLMNAANDFRDAQDPISSAKAAEAGVAVLSAVMELQRGVDADIVNYLALADLAATAHSMSQSLQRSVEIASEARSVFDQHQFTNPAARDVAMSILRSLNAFQPSQSDQVENTGEKVIEN